MSQSNTPREKPLILMVDDVPKNLQVLGNILGDQYLITPAMSGEQALARVEQLMPDLILLDVMMPGIDGFETCRQIKANQKTKEIPIIFLTAKVETVDVLKGFNVGAVDYVAKPFQAEELLTRVETHISLRKKTVELKSLYTELKQSEEKYHGLFDSSIDAIIRINSDFQIKDANPGSEKLFGYPIEKIVKNSFTFFLTPDKEKSLKKIITQEVYTNGYSKAFESEILKKDQDQDTTSIPVEMRLWTSGESDKGIWILIKDNSETKAMQQLRDDVDRIMRHDLKNPLSGIIGLSDLLKVANDGFSDDQKQWIEQIHKSGLQALTMVNHSMDIFKMEQGKYTYLPIPCNLVPIFKKIEIDFFQLLRSKRLDILFSIQNKPVNEKDIYSVMGEKALLETLFANLIKNAIEASPDNQSISINVFPDNDEHKITIHNQGTIPKKIQNKFFDKYATSGKKGGTGLGTYSAKLITKTHNGNINFISNETDGTKLIVSLPKSSQDTIQQNSKNIEINSNTSIKEIPKFKKQLRMLVADDSPNNMLLIGHYLEKFPCVIDFADNGKACVDYFKTSKYDLVLVDLQMPVMNGLDAITNIRAYEKENTCIPTPIVAISADNDESIKKQCLDVGCNEFLSKPFSEDNIQNIVVNFCKNS